MKGPQFLRFCEPVVSTLRELGGEGRSGEVTDSVIEQLSADYKVVYRPGPGIARIRHALTDLQKSNPALNTVPQTKLAGLGLGAASMEGEVLDSETGEAIAAVVQSQSGSRLSLDGMSDWGDVKAIIDGWAKEFKGRFDAAHGR